MLSKVLITGAGGFIGRSLWGYLDRHDYEVIACMPCEPADCALPRGQRLLIRMPDGRLGAALARERPDYAIHCAGGASVAQSFAMPALDFANNVISTEALAEAVAANSPDTRTIFISSAAVYGNPVALPIREDAVTAPISPYGYHKLMAELICQKYHRLHGVPVTILRVFSAYGPGLRKQILWDLYQQWVASGSISLRGSGEESRDFIFIDDLVTAIHLVMERATFSAEVLNVAEGRAITVRRLATLMLTALGAPKPLYFTHTPRRGDPVEWQADVAKIRTLGVTPGLPIEHGLEEYVRWLRAGERV